MSLPEYLDWMPIEVKIFWFTERGDGEPEASYLLFTSQGEQQIVPLEKPLRRLDYSQIKEKDIDLEERTERWIERQGISRTPRNQ